MLDTKIAFVVADDLPVWRRLNVVAFLTTGITPQLDAEVISGEPYRDVSDQAYAALRVCRATRMPRQA